MPIELNGSEIVVTGCPTVDDAHLLSWYLQDDEDGPRALNLAGAEEISGMVADVILTHGVAISAMPEDMTVAAILSVLIAEKRLNSDAA